MALGETSLPVPAVVGTQMSGRVREVRLPMPKASVMRLGAVGEGGDELGYVEG